eukprot:Gb_05855 [translate_table: standard]
MRSRTVVGNNNDSEQQWKIVDSGGRQDASERWIEWALIPIGADLEVSPVEKTCGNRVTMNRHLFIGSDTNWSGPGGTLHGDLQGMGHKGISIEIHSLAFLILPLGLLQFMSLKMSFGGTQFLSCGHRG